MNILEQIHSPAELKYLSETQLEIVATQIRELIIKTVAQNGEIGRASCRERV